MKLFGFGARTDKAYREDAGKEYDPDMDATPARLHCAHTRCGPFRSKVQMECHLHAAVQALINIDLEADHPEAYREAREWLLSYGFEEKTKSATSFEIDAKCFLSRLEAKYGSS